MDEQNVLLVLFIISLITIVCTHKILHRSITRTAKKNHLPTPPSVPIIGLLLSLKKPVHLTLLTLSRTHGPIISLRLGVRRVLIISSRSLIKECFTRNDTVLVNPPNYLLGKHISYNYFVVLAAPYGDHLRNLRRIITTQILSLHSLDASLDIRREEVGRLLLKLGWNRSASGFARVELKSTLTDLTLNMMIRVTVGKRYYEEDVTDVEEAKAFRDMIKEVMRFTTTLYPSY